MTLMKKILLGNFLFFFSTLSFASDLVPNDKYALIIASRPTLVEAEEYISTLPNTKYVNVYKTQNGWYAISLGFLNDDELHVLDELKRSQKIPQDSFCTRGNSFVREVSFSNPERIVKNDITGNQSSKGCNLKDEITACYAVTLGPKLCTQLISEENPRLAESFGSRYALGVACSHGVNSQFARANLPETMAIALFDEGMESGCSMVKNDDIFSKILGGAFCFGSAMSWAARIDATNHCIRQAKRYCN